MHTCECIHACTHTHTHVYVCVCTCSRVCVYVSVCMHEYRFACVCMHTHACLCVHVLVHVHTCVHMPVCMYVHVKSVWWGVQRLGFCRHGYRQHCTGFSLLWHGLALGVGLVQQREFLTVPAPLSVPGLSPQPEQLRMLSPLPFLGC